MGDRTLVLPLRFQTDKGLLLSISSSKQSSHNDGFSTVLITDDAKKHLNYDCSVAVVVPVQRIFRSVIDYKEIPELVRSVINAGRDAGSNAVVRILAIGSFIDDSEQADALKKDPSLTHHALLDHRANGKYWVIYKSAGGHTGRNLIQT